MSDVRAEEVVRWLIGVDDDLAAIRGCLAVEPKAVRGAAFHRQQATEKMLKALLVLAGRRFRYIHDLAELADECAKVWPDLAVDFAEVIPLSKWATAYRYPGLEEAFDQPPKPEHIEQVLERLLLLRAKCDSVVAATRSSPRQAPE